MRFASIAASIAATGLIQGCEQRWLSATDNSVSPSLKNNPTLKSTVKPGTSSAISTTTSTAMPASMRSTSAKTSSMITTMISSTVVPSSSAAPSSIISSTVAASSSSSTTVGPITAGPGGALEFRAPPSQPDTSTRFNAAGDYYERLFLEGEGDVESVVHANQGPMNPSAIVRNEVGQWVVNNHMHSVSCVGDSLANLLSNDHARDIAEADYMVFWMASEGPRLMREAGRNCGRGPFVEAGLTCYNLMMLATNIPVPPDRKPRHVARDIGLDRFCLDNEAALVQELTMRIDQTVGRGRPGMSPVEKYGESIKVGYAANWLSFCPNLIEASNRQVREMVFNHGVFRAKVFAASFRDDLHPSLQVQRQTLFQDALGGFLSDRNIGQLFIPVARVEFEGEAGIGQGVVTNWYDEMSAQIFGADSGLFEYVNSNRYVKLKSDVLAQARASGNEMEVRRRLRAAGRFFGHVIAVGRKLSADLTTMFYARLLGKIIGIEALREYEPQQYRYWRDAHEAADYTLLPIPDQAGLPDDADWPESVPDQEYVIDRAASDFVTYYVKEEYSEITRGLFEVIPQSVFESGIKTKQFREILFGALDVDVEDMFQNWRLDGFNAHSQQIVWLQQILRGFDQLNRRKFVGFVTGSSNVPAGGFRMYEFVGVRYKFTIQIKDGNNVLPTSANCFNRLKIGTFSSRDQMQRLLLISLEHGAGFGLV